MGVEAARRALAALAGAAPDDLFFSTPAPAYLDKTNATAIHAALELPAWTGAYDMLGSVRSAVGALRAAQAQARPTAPVAGRALRPAHRTGRRCRGARQRRRCRGLRLRPDGGDAPVVGRAGGPRRARPPSSSTGGVPRVSPTRRCGRSASARRSTSRWSRRPPPRRSSGPASLAADVDHLVAGRPPRAGRAGGAAPPSGCVPRSRWPTGRRSSATSGRPRPGCCWPTSSTGPARASSSPWWSWPTAPTPSCSGPPTHLPAVRADRAAAGLRHGGRVRPAPGRDDLPYARFLTWRGELRREPPAGPTRSDRVPRRPGGHARGSTGSTASDCRACGFRHLPPARVCLRCRTIDEMDPVRLADVAGTVATFTVDHLAFSLVPAGGRCGGRLRRWRPVPVRDDRRRPRHASPSARGSR